MLSRRGDFYKNSVAFTIWKNILSMCAENKKPNVFVLDWLPNIEIQSNWSPRILGFLLYLLNLILFFILYNMEEKNFRPDGFIDVWVKLDHNVNVFNPDDEPTEREEENLHMQMGFNDYCSLMWDMKIKAFIAWGSRIINKMHIVEVRSSLSPHVAMSVSGFIHSSRYSAFEQWCTREEAYNSWCEWLPGQFERNKMFLSPNRNK